MGGVTMSVVVAFAVAERSAELFKTAIFRFMELKTVHEEQDLIIRTANDPTHRWVRAELEFSSPVLAEEFNQFMGRMRLDLTPLN